MHRGEQNNVAFRNFPATNVGHIDRLFVKRMTAILKTKLALDIDLRLLHIILISQKPILMDT